MSVTKASDGFGTNTSFIQRNRVLLTRFVRVVQTVSPIVNGRHRLRSAVQSTHPAEAASFSLRKVEPAAVAYLHADPWVGRQVLILLF